MIFVLLSWLAMFVMICSTGGLAVSGVARFSRAIALRNLDVFQLFWIGFAVVVAASQVLNFFLPLGPLVLVLWIMASFAGLPAFVRSLATGNGSVLNSGRPLDRFKVAVFILIGAFALYSGSSGVSTCLWGGVYDTDLYHFNSIRWINEYATVPGLGNLHCRLGFTSGFLILSALLDNLWWDGHTAWLTYAFVVTVACIQWLGIILFPGQEAPARRRLFCLLTSPYLIGLVTTTCPMLYYDNIVLLVQLVLFSELLRYSSLASRADEPSWPVSVDRATWLMVVVTLAALGFSIKATGALALCFVLMLSAVLLFGRALWNRTGLRRLLKPVVAVYLIAGVLLTGHILRNVVLTGWLLYPAPIGNTHVEWAMPEYPVNDSGVEAVQPATGLAKSDPSPFVPASVVEEVQSVGGLSRIIRAWAQMPGLANYRTAITGGFRSWFPSWRDRVWHGIEPLCLYSGLAFAIIHIVLIAVTGAGRSRETLQDLLLLGLAMANMAFWFLSAPDMRFGCGFFWIWMGLGGCMVLSRQVVRPVLAYVVTVFVIVYALCSTSVHFSRPPDEMWRVGKAEAKATRKVILNNGQEPRLEVNVPVQGDRCGDCDLPATPYPRDTLQLRKPDSLRSGFKMAGRK